MKELYIILECTWILLTFVGIAIAVFNLYKMKSPTTTNGHKFFNDEWNEERTDRRTSDEECGVSGEQCLCDKQQDKEGGNQ